MSMPRPQQRMQPNRQQTHLLRDAEHNEGDSDHDPACPLFNVSHTLAKPLL